MSDAYLRSQSAPSTDWEGFLDGLQQEPSQHWIANADTQWSTVSMNGHRFPMTINDGCSGDGQPNSYVCSPYNGMITYPLEEVQRVPSAMQRGLLRALIHSIAKLLRSAPVDRAISINNWLLSTNLYPEWDGQDLESTTKEFQLRYPHHAILFRSLNQRLNFRLVEELQQSGYRLAPSRQVYLFDGRQGHFATRPNTQRDLKLLAKTPLKECQHQDIFPSDYPRIQQLYNWLYLEKYSQHNPHFTCALIQHWHQTGVLQMAGFRNEHGVLEAVIGCFQINNVLSAPLVGYNTSWPAKAGLYRLLMAWILRKSLEERKWLNLSSGAAHFKRLRGGEPEMEYTAVCYQHLPTHPRWVWSVVVQLLDRIGKPVLEKNKL